jgi:ABC-type transporter Mla subunit MlaD
LSELDAIRSQFLEGALEASAEHVRVTQQQRELFEDAIRQAQRPLEEMERQLNRARHDLKDTVEQIQPTVRQSMEEIKPLIVEVASPAIADMEGAFRNLAAEGSRINESVNQLLLKVETEVVRGLESSLHDLLGTADRLTDRVSTEVNPAVDEFRTILQGASGEIRQSSQSAISAIVELRSAHEATVAELRNEVNELRTFLSRSQDFERVASALSENLEMTERISVLLTEQRPGLSTRLELALIALVAGGLIGIGLGGLQLTDAVLVALPGASVALWSEPIVSRLLRGLGRGENGRGRGN